MTLIIAIMLLLANGWSMWWLLLIVPVWIAHILAHG